MNRVSIRTLALMLALLAYFVAYQCLAFIPPAKTCGTTRAVRPGPSACVNASQDPNAAAAPQPGSSDDTPVLESAAEVCETVTIWGYESTADPNEAVDPNDSGAEPVIVE